MTSKDPGIEQEAQTSCAPGAALADTPELHQRLEALAEALERHPIAAQVARFRSETSHERDLIAVCIESRCLAATIFHRVNAITDRLLFNREPS